MPSSWTMRTLLSLVIVCSSFAKFTNGITKITTTIISPKSTSRNGRSSLSFICERSRGGATSNNSKKSRKRKKKSKESVNKGEAKKAIDDAMKEKDTAESLGDAIR